jgi:cobalt/nickel transport system permease protein
MTLAPDVPARTPQLLRRLDPRWRLATLAVWAVAASAVITPAGAVAGFAGSVAVVALAALPPLWVVRRLQTVVPFLLMLAVPMILLRGEAGARAAGLVALKTSAVALTAMTLFALSPLPELLRAGRSFGVPATLLHVVLLAERYVFVLTEEFGRLRVAARARGFRFGASPRSYRILGTGLGALTVRGLARADRVGRAMACRGFDGFMPRHVGRTSLGDVAAFLAAVTAAAALLAADRWPWS